MVAQRPTVERWWGLYASGLVRGLSARAAWLYATLAWWGEHFSIPAPRITSGKRSRAAQARLFRRWEQGLSRFPVATPGTSKHETGEAFDLADNGFLHWYGAWALELGAVWGGNFRRSDPIHYESGGLTF